MTELILMRVTHFENSVQLHEKILKNSLEITLLSLLKLPYSYFSV